MVNPASERAGRGLVWMSLPSMRLGRVPCRAVASQSQVLCMKRG